MYDVIKVLFNPYNDTCKLESINIYSSEAHRQVKNEKKTHTVITIPKSNIKIVKRDKFDHPSTHIHDHTLTWHGTGTSIKSGGVDLVTWIQRSPLSKND